MEAGVGERRSLLVLQQVLLGGARGGGEGRGGQRWNVKWEGPENKKAVITMYRLIFKALCPKQARRQGGFEGVRANPPFGFQKIHIHCFNCTF